jgi:biopolymer transport protein ExbD
MMFSLRGTERREGSLTGLRTRFFPRSRIGQGLIAVAPWVNLVLLIVLFSMVESRVVLQPGLVVSLPPATFRDGLRSSLVAVVLAVGGGTAPREEIVFFNDQRYTVSDAKAMENLKEALARAREAKGEEGLIVQADQRVSHGTIVELMNMALEVGLKKVNLAEKPR